MTRAPRRVAVVTGSRAEYGLLRWLMAEIAADPALELQVIACAMHLSPEFGLTYREIEADGFRLAARVEMLLSSDTPMGTAKSVALGVLGFADAFERLRPDVVVVLGDRFEILAAAQAAMLARIPIAHLHGGELTEGAIDEAIRHAITKMAHLHFVAADAYAARVIQMGEQPERVFNFGAPGLDNVTRLALLDRAAFEESVGLRLGDPCFLVTYHPVTLEAGGAEHAVASLLRALDRFPSATILFTRPNADAEGRRIGELIDEYAALHPGRTAVHTSLGQLRYLSAIRHADAVVGNSSSGLIEVPALGKPTVNIGARQQGRLRAPSVIDCGEDADEIAAALGRALSPEFRDSLAGAVSPYGHGNASARIRDVLREVELEGILAKRFHDLARPAAAGASTQ